MMFLNRIYTICLFILLMTYNTNSYKRRREGLGNNTSFPLNSSPLRRLVEPLSYDIFLDTISEDYTFIGLINIFFIIEYPTVQINLNADGLRAKKEHIYISRNPYRDRYKITNLSYQEESLILSFKTEIPSGLYTMRIAYIGFITEQEVGLYRTICKDCTGASKWIFVTQLKPTAARVFPCWDDPVFRTRFEFEIRHYQNYISSSNMPVQEAEYINDGTMKTKFHSTAPIPAYLVAFALMDFCSSGNEYNFTIRVCFTSLDQKQITFIQSITYDVIAYMQLYTEMSPQLREITHIGLPDFSYESAGNWGFNIYREDHLIYNETLHPIEHKLDVWMYVSSMVALQWVGNLVSPTSWTHMWFCQTLALFYGVKAFIKTYNDEDIKSFLTYRLQSIARENHVVSQVKLLMHPADNPDENDTLVRSSHFTNCLKEYAIITMLEYTVTESEFQKATIAYLEKYQFSTATPNDFWDILQERADSTHPSIQRMVQTWFEQRSLPIIMVTRNHIDDFRDEIVIKAGGFHVFIPINYVKTSSPGEVSSIMWLHPYLSYNFEIVQLECLIVNWQYTGYYRVQYDNSSLNILTMYLKSEERTKIHVLNRAHIIEDAYYFWMEGKFNISMFLNLIRFMSNEEQCAPWYAMQNIMPKMWPFFNIDIGTHAKQVIVSVLKDLLDKVGYMEHSNDTECLKFKRLLATKWACRLLHPPCLEIAQKRLDQHLRDPEIHTISPMWEEWTYCNGLVLSKSTWGWVFAEYNRTRNNRILKYLACSTDIDVICNYLDLAMSNNSVTTNVLLVNSEDRRNIYRSIVKKHISKKEVLDCVLEKMKPMEIDDEFIEIISYIIKNVYSKRQMGEISSLLLKKKVNVKRYDRLEFKLYQQYSYIRKFEQLTKRMGNVREKE